MGLSLRGDAKVDTALVHNRRAPGPNPACGRGWEGAEEAASPSALRLQREAGSCSGPGPQNSLCLEEEKQLLPQTHKQTV